MARDEKLKKRWETLVEKLSLRFADGAPLDLDGIIYLIGVQELGGSGKKIANKSKLLLGASGAAFVAVPLIITLVKKE